MPLIYHVELQRAVNIAKGMMLHLVLFDLGLRGIHFIALYIYFSVYKLSCNFISYDDHGNEKS